MNKLNVFVIIEYVWILMAVFCLIMGVYYQIETGTDKVWLLYGLSVISFGMFAVRRQQRKNNEKKQKRRQ